MMYKKLLVVILLICIGTLQARDTSNKWNGFRDYGWGINLELIAEDDSDLKKTYQNKKCDLATWRCQDEKLAIGKADLESVGYTTYKNRFCGISIKSKGRLNFEHLKDTIFTSYGKGKKCNVLRDKWVWLEADTNGKVIAILEWTFFNKETSFILCYSPIWEQYYANKK